MRSSRLDDFAMQAVLPITPLAMVVDCAGAARAVASARQLKTRPGIPPGNPGLVTAAVHPPA